MAPLMLSSLGFLPPSLAAPSPFTLQLPGLLFSPCCCLKHQLQVENTQVYSTGLNPTSGCQTTSPPECPDLGFPQVSRAKQSPWFHPQTSFLHPSCCLPFLSPLYLTSSQSTPFSHTYVVFIPTAQVSESCFAGLPALEFASEFPGCAASQILLSCSLKVYIVSCDFPLQ